MQNRMWTMWTTAGALALTGWLVGGCPAAIPEQKVPFALSASLGEFDVVAGETLQKKGTLSFDAGGITIGRGSLEIDAGSISVTPTGATQNKSLAVAQVASTCLDTCAAGGVDAAVCGDVCDGGAIDVTVWIGSVADGDAVCGLGDLYGPYRVTLDAADVPVSVVPTTVAFTDRTIALLNSGELRVCIQVISPVDGVVTLGSLTFNLGL